MVETNLSEDQEITLKGIILRHIGKIGLISCQEFTPGYWDKKPFKTQSGVIFTEVYHPDVRETYCNAIDFLLDVVEPNADEQFLTFIKELEREEDQIFKKHKDKEDKNEWLKEKVVLRRKIFKEIFFMFKRIRFFDETDVYKDDTEHEIIDDGEHNTDLPE